MKMCVECVIREHIDAVHRNSGGCVKGGKQGVSQLNGFPLEDLII